MSVTKIQLKDEFSGTKSEGSEGTRVYHVFCNSLEDDTDTALYADDGTDAIPGVGDAWKLGSAKKVTGKDAKRVQDDSQFLYEVTVAYSSSAKAQSTAANPLSAPVRVSRRSASARETYFKDVDDARVTNSAGDPFAELPERDVAELWQFTITKNVAGASASGLQPYLNSLNSGSVSVDGDTLAAGQGKIDAIEVSEKQTAQLSDTTTVDYYTLTVTITAKPTWDDEFEDRGVKKADGTDILNPHGERVSDPWPLDGSGLPKANASDAPASIIRKPYLRKAWPASLYS